MSYDPIASPAPHEAPPDDHSSTAHERELAEVPTEPVANHFPGRSDEDLAFLSVAIAGFFEFDEWSAVVIARTVEHGNFEEPEDAVCLGEAVRCALAAASLTGDVSDHNQFVGDFDVARDGYWLHGWEERLPEKARNLIDTLFEMRDYQLLVLVRQMQLTLDEAKERNISLVDMLREVDLIRDS